jgi:N-acetylglutamate synthase-like GNAT family acetyltransferase
MARAARRTELVPAEFSEKQFYLDEFRGRTIVFAVGRRALEKSSGGDALAGVVRDLLPNDTRVVVLVDAGGDAAQAQRRVRRRLESPMFHEPVTALFPHLRNRVARAAVFAVLDADESLRADTLAQMWAVLRRTPVFVGIVPCESARLADFAQRLATRLRVHKLVLVEDEGGVADPNGKQMSFLDGDMLDALLHHGEAEWTGLAHRRETLEAVSNALDGGVAAVNLCALSGLARELFSYEGSGTLFTHEDYCRVSPLGVDDFEEVERLIERGQREGFLKVRSPGEIAQIVLCGFGATIGNHHLAGICGLFTEPYERERAGEVVALYTVTRFKGEGVGGKLLAHVEAEARQRRLRYLFAVTTEERAKVFFERSGFKPVKPAAVPAAKWQHYDRKRLAAITVYKKSLERSR